MSEQQKQDERRPQGFTVWWAWLLSYTGGAANEKLKPHHQNATLQTPEWGPGPRHRGCVQNSHALFPKFIPKFGFFITIIKTLAKHWPNGHLITVSPLHTNLQAANFQRCECAYQPLYASCYTVLLYFSRYCTVRFKMFYFLVFFIYLLFVWKVL